VWIGRTKMETKRIEKDGIVILAVKGEVTVKTYSELRQVFERLFAEGAKKLVVNFKEVSYVDSMGLSVLIEVLQRFRQDQRSIVFANVIDKIRYLFEVTKIDMLMSIYDSQEAAIDSL
jgi:anti-sigma B factor antagonist